MKRVLLVVVASFLLALPDPLFAVDGPIPIWQSTTIRRPGKYVVTRNITSASSVPVLTIAASNVQVDLNGFTLRHSGQVAVVVADNVNSIVVGNGVIAADGSHEGIRFTNVHRFAIRHLMVTKSGFNETGISLSKCENGSVDHNIVDGAFELSLWVAGGLGINARHNVLRNTDCEGGAIFATDNSVFANNILEGCSSLRVEGSGNAIVSNSVGATGGAAAILVIGVRNRIEHNTLVNNGGYGLLFGIGSSENMYSDNFARGNHGSNCVSPSPSSDFCDLGTNNTSGGDNFMPSRM